MKTETMLVNTRKQKSPNTFAIIAFLLAIPLVAMQFSNEVNWNGFDFLVMGTLLLSTSLSIAFISRKVKSIKWRIGISIAMLILLFLIWAELAVGIFGFPITGS
ncbi:hypothetical protein [Pedobacter sp. ASV28]|uniref:hypothetical protein n=1 Tax=Pedobacter sp. ASV28 TaxID=2795123 RepID=UPI0018EBBCFE|nr:hypothetical protein [Pedobacter sp. ASV28]